jgi:hypothetical protein
MFVERHLCRLEAASCPDSASAPAGERRSARGSGDDAASNRTVLFLKKILADSFVGHPDAPVGPDGSIK